MKLVTTGKTSGEKDYKASVREIHPGEDINHEIDLSALFKPRFKIEFEVGGVVVPFYYNKLDPGTLLLTHESPIASAAARSLKSKFEAAGIDPENPEVTEENLDRAREILEDPDTASLADRGRELQVRVLIKAVLSPKLTEEVIENLDQEIVDVLYKAITGGISTDNKSVGDFSDVSDTSEE